MTGVDEYKSHLGDGGGLAASAPFLAALADALVSDGGHTIFSMTIFPLNREIEIETEKNQIDN